MSKEMLTTQEASEFLGIAAGTLANQRARGEGPVFVKYGRTIRYRRVDLEKYIEVRVWTPNPNEDEHVIIQTGDQIK